MRCSCWSSSSSPGSDVVGFVAAAREASSSSKLRELQTKLSITESAIAKVTQELVARGEDIREKKTKKNTEKEKTLGHDFDAMLQKV